MAFQVSPGVQVKEVDLTNVVPAVSSSVGAFVGNFAWGPVEQATTITSEKDLANVFGVPKANASVDFFTAAYFLKYGNNLQVVREIDASATNANTDDSSTVTVVKNRDHYDTQVFSGTTITVTADLGTGGTAVATASDGSGQIILDDASALTVGDGIVGNGLPVGGANITDISGNTITVDSITGTVQDGDEFQVAVVKGVWLAKYPGSLGNSLKVSICPTSTNDTFFNGWAYKALFTQAPGTSDYATNVGGSNDELHIVVIDEDGAWTGTAGTVLETFGFVSQASDAKTNDGTSNYYKNVINDTSGYIWWGAHAQELSNAGQAAASQTFANVATAAIDLSLVGGNDSSALGASEIATGFDLFSDSAIIDVSFLIMPSATSSDASTVASNLATIAEQRKDCIAFVSPAVSATSSSLTPKADVIAFADALSPRSSYAVIDSTSLKVYDKYNDQYINIPASSSVAGLCANTDDVADAWFSPAGFTRGQLRGITKINYNPKKADRDELYLKSINPIVTFPGEGTVLFGDKTAQVKPSAFDRVNVRRLFIVLEKAISTAAKFQLFEFNDEFTRAQFRNLVEPFLREVKGRRGLTDFFVVCDETNNTGDVVDRNEFVADIYIKPARSINFITLNFIATRTGVEFSEIVGQ